VNSYYLRFVDIGIYWWTISLRGYRSPSISALTWYIGYIYY